MPDPELPSATPAAYAIPVAGSGGILDVGFLGSGTPDGTKFVRDDSTLAVPTGTVPGGAAGGDLTGTYPDPTIGADKVTYAKMQNVSATDKVLGRSTAGAGDVEEIACTATARGILAANQGAAIASPTGGVVVDTECRAQLVLLLAFFRTRGDIAT